MTNKKMLLLTVLTIALGMVCSITEAELNEVIAKGRMMVKDRKLQASAEVVEHVSVSGHEERWADDDP